MNTIGNKFRFTSFGESHGVAIGGVIDGCPSGMTIDTDLIQQDLLRRKKDGSARAQNEADEIEWLSGIFEGKTLGSPIAFMIRNTDAHSEDYEALKNVYREGHADWVYEQKYGLRDWRGGGRSSGRITVGWVVAGSIAKQILLQKNIHIAAECIRVNEGNDGEVECIISGMPIGIGDPVFGKLSARLSFALMSIPAVDSFTYQGGINGGISNGQDITIKVHVKAPATDMNVYGGRHDICIAKRLPVIAEAMVAITIADYLV